MAAALIRIDQLTHATDPIGTAGRSRDDIEINEQVRLVNANDAGVRTHFWEILAQPDMSAPVSLSNPIAPNPTFTPNVAGTYRVRLRVNEGRAGERDVRTVVVRDADGNRFPAVGEEDESNWDDPDTGQPNERGWWDDLRRMIEGAGGGVDVTDGTTTVLGATGIELDPAFFVVSNEGGGVAGATLDPNAVVEQAGVLHEQDLSALATNAFTDGSEAIGTLGNVTVVNTANAGANWGLVDGTGLRMSLTTGIFDSSNLTAPYFYFPVSQLPGYRVGYPLFIDIVIAASTFASGNDRFLMGVWGPAGAPLAANSSRNKMGIRGNNGGTNTIGTQSAGTRQYATETITPTAMSVRISPEGAVQVGHGSYAGSWPDFTYVQGQNTLATTIEQFMYPGLRVAFAMSTGAGLAGSIDISRWRFRQ